MSTRSAVCEPFGDGYRGRYIHSDGYPTGVGGQLCELVQRDGLDKVRQTLIHDHYGWSFLRPNQVRITRKLIAEAKRAVKAEGGDWRFRSSMHDYASPYYQAWYWDAMNSDGRYDCVPGYGTAFSDRVIDMFGQPYQQITEDEWVTPDYDNDTVWRYVLSPDGLMVHYGFGAWPRYIGTIPYDIASREAVEALGLESQQVA